RQADRLTAERIPLTVQDDSTIDTDTIVVSLTEDTILRLAPDTAPTPPATETSTETTAAADTTAARTSSTAATGSTATVTRYDPPPFPAATTQLLDNNKRVERGYVELVWPDIA